MCKKPVAKSRDMIEFHPDPLFVSGEDRSKKYQLQDKRQSERQVHQKRSSWPFPKGTTWNNKGCTCIVTVVVSWMMA